MEFIDRHVSTVGTHGELREDGKLPEHFEEPMDELSIACHDGDWTMVQHLLSLGAICPAHTNPQHPILLTARQGHTNLLAEMLEAWPEMRTSDIMLYHLLASACRGGHLNTAVMLLDSYHAPTAVRPQNNAREELHIEDSPLYASATSGCEELAVELVQRGTPITSYLISDHPEFTKNLLHRLACGHMTTAFTAWVAQSRRVVEQMEPTCEDVEPNKDDEINNGLVVRWARLQLPWLEVSWIVNIAHEVADLDVSENALSTLPTVLPWGLQALRRFSAFGNKLIEIPCVLPEQVFCHRLEEIDLSHNILVSLPPALFSLQWLQKLNASYNLLSEFGSEELASWNKVKLRRLACLDLSYNQLEDLSVEVVHLFNGLLSLNLSHNLLVSLPPAWTCPMENLNASHNQLESVPSHMPLHWTRTLVQLDFSHNYLLEVPTAIFQLEVMTSLNLSGNQLVALPSAREWKCHRLVVLDLSGNLLGSQSQPTRNKLLQFFTRRTRHSFIDEGPLEFPRFLEKSLEVLNLTENALEFLPASLCNLLKLRELFLSRNPNLHELPLGLGSLKHLWSLDLSDLEVQNVPQDLLKASCGTAAVLAYLRAKQRQAERCYSLKLLVVGSHRHGKTSLLGALQGRPVVGGSPSEASVSSTPASHIALSLWDLQRPSGICGEKLPDLVRMSVWELGGPACAMPAHQCFFTNKALFLVIWNLVLGEEGVEALQSWLLSIQARAPNAAVVIVGTHLDALPQRFQQERIATLRAHILSLCHMPGGGRMPGCPNIVHQHLAEVSSRTGTGVYDLRKLIYQVASTMKDVGNPIPTERLVGRLVSFAVDIEKATEHRLVKVPQSFLLLHKAVQAEKERRRQSHLVQYLTETEFKALATQHMEGGLVNSEDEMQQAVTFLVEVGCILHFPDASRGLRSLYFLDAAWLWSCLQCVFSPTVHAKAQESCLSEHQLWAFLQKSQLPEDGRQPWLQLLARFEIALPLQDGRYLLPHLLPEKPSSTLSPEPTSPTRAHTLLRHVQMSFVPMGFWQRLIARLLISLSSMERTGLTSVWNRLQVTSTLDRDKQDAAGTRALYRHGSTFCVRQARKVYWQEGLCACYANGFLSVEALGRRTMQTTNHSGIAIMVQSQSQDLSAVAFVMDHVTSLIEQWFPALLGTEPDGTPFVQQLIPCSRCLLTPSPSTQTQLDPSVAILNAPEQLPHMFRLEECLLRAVTDDRILCPKHPDRPVPLPQLVPEIFMTDFPRRYFLECSKLTIIDGDAGYLGQGGSGTTIRRAHYQGTVVALKIFTILSCNEDDDMLRDLYANRIARVFAEFRLEARMLQSLRHPCIPALLGIMLYPLCLALELAPHGSLRLVLDAAELVPVPLGPLLSYKVAHQVALALAYLHRKDIIFCDLKSDNVLMWSLDPNETVNAKLSDYGISRLSFGQGARGTEGTPGYQAPEVCPGIIYDEKVDMFSYGMLLFELLSGQRPTLQGKPMEVLRKLNRGLRPSFPRPVHTTCKTLALLATRCWQTAPEQRPAAQEVISHLQHPSSVCLRCTLDCGWHDTCFCCQSMHMALLWHQEGMNRTYSLVNTEHAVLETERMACAGGKVTCFAKVGSAVWLGTKLMERMTRIRKAELQFEVSTSKPLLNSEPYQTISLMEMKIEVYVLQEMCPLRAPEVVLSVPSQVTCLLALPEAQDDEFSVFAGLEDGNVAVFTGSCWRPDSNCSFVCPSFANLSLFGIPEQDPRQALSAVRAMTSALGHSEIWFGNGPGIMVLKRSGLRPSRRLDACTETSSRLISMATIVEKDNDGKGTTDKEMVCALDDHTNEVIMCDVALCIVVARYHCGVEDPLFDSFMLDMKDMLIVKSYGSRGLQVLVNNNSIEGEELESFMLDSPSQLECAVTFTTGNTASATATAVALDATKCKLSTTTATLDGTSTTTMTTMLDGIQTMNMASARVEWIDRTTNVQLEGDGIAHVEPVRRQKTLMEEKLTAVCIVAVHDCIWVPRRGGDILVLHVNRKEGVGKVIARLQAPVAEKYSVLKSAGAVLGGTVVCNHISSLGSTMLSIWHPWSSDDFELFYRFHDDLQALSRPSRTCS